MVDGVLKIYNFFIILSFFIMRETVKEVLLFISFSAA